MKLTRPKFGAAPSLEELASHQGVRSITDFNALLGRPSTEDQSNEEFSAMLRMWRREGAGSVRPRTQAGANSEG